MRIVRHPFVERDLIGMVDHIVDVTQGDIAAAERRLDEVDALIASIIKNPGPVSASVAGFRAGSCDTAVQVNG